MQLSDILDRVHDGMDRLGAKEVRTQFGKHGMIIASARFADGRYCTVCLSPSECVEAVADIPEFIVSKFADLLKARGPGYQPETFRVPLESKGAQTAVRMALNCLEELQQEAMDRKRRYARNFNEHMERETQLTAARISLDHALEILAGNRSS